MDSSPPFSYTPLHTQHLEAHAKMVMFAGYDMPVQYEGIKTEHLWVRSRAGIFDVSHMGQAYLTGKDIPAFLMTLTPSSFTSLAAGQAKYTVLMNKKGGIIDDCIVTKLTDEHYFIVYNAACKAKDEAWIQEHLPTGLTFTPLHDRALIAVQGPKSATVVQSLFPDIDILHQPYMTVHATEDHIISRLGYTGEDGFEISLPASEAPALWKKLLAHPDIKPIGLGARDSLRLEAGYPLYGHDLDDTTSPVEANLSWLIRKQNLSCFGHARIEEELDTHPRRLRVGVALSDKGIIREDTIIVNLKGRDIGVITSGGFGPSVNKGIAQGYIEYDQSSIGTAIYLPLRGRILKATVAPLTFVPIQTRSKKPSLFS